MAKILDDSQRLLRVRLYGQNISFVSSNGNVTCTIQGLPTRTVDPQLFADAAARVLDWFASSSPRSDLNEVIFNDTRYRESGGQLYCEALHDGQAGATETAAAFQPIVARIVAWLSEHGINSA